jgi:hypothetical protein
MAMRGEKKRLREERPEEVAHSNGQVRQSTARRAAVALGVAAAGALAWRRVTTKRE